MKIILDLTKEETETLKRQLEVWDEGPSGEGRRSDALCALEKKVLAALEGDVAGSKYKSNAQWPEGTLGGYNHDISDDSHSTKEEAHTVCMMLEKHGFAGEGKIFPIQTWVCSKVIK